MLVEFDPRTLSDNHRLLNNAFDLFLIINYIKFPIISKAMKILHVKLILSQCSGIDGFKNLT